MDQIRELIGYIIKYFVSKGFIFSPVIICIYNLFHSLCKLNTLDFVNTLKFLNGIS